MTGADNPAAGGEKVYSISELTRLIKEMLEGTFPSIWVEGEISKVTDHSSGHLYLTLKEEKDTLDITMWRSSRRGLQFKLETGLKVLVRGRMSNYGPYGKYNLVADRIEPSGLGALQLKFEQLKKKLAAKGYFDEARKRPLPPFPATVGIVTSPTGAAFRDVVRIIRRRNPAVKIVLAPVLVEGERAKYQVARAVDDFNTWGKADVLIVGRGGGSPESLWAFNEEVVADAIYRSRIPVISAVGHEVDFTIADFVADLRASTPSAAAELAVKNADDVLRGVADSVRAALNAVRGLVRERRAGVADLVRRPVFADPSRFLEEGRRRTDDALSRMVVAAGRGRADRLARLAALRRHLGLLKPSEQIRRRLERVQNLERRLAQKAVSAAAEKRQEFSAAAGKLNALSPMKVLERGYSITRALSGEVVRDAARVRPGDLLETLLHKGKIWAKVIEK